MTEIYQGWLNNPDTRHILEAYGADKLTEEQQAAFETVVKARWTPPP